MSADLVDGDDVSEAAILEELRRRFAEDIIYSSIGPIVIAINPYKDIQAIYSANNMNIYMQHSRKQNLITNESLNKPHVWSIAQSAYNQLYAEKKRQAVIISGESGAGKTEATKKCLQYLSKAAAKRDEMKGVTRTTVDCIAVEDRVLATNPILESFGNSKTSRNNNSSRFGKWLEIHFVVDEKNDGIELSGASITQYLLEKSRVVTQSVDERNFHIFYQLCSDPNIIGLQAASHYRYLQGVQTKGSHNTTMNIRIDGVDDGAEYKLTVKSMDDLRFSDTDKDVIFSALKAILLLGNIDLLIAPATTIAGGKDSPNGNGDSSAATGAVIVGETSLDILQECAALLGFRLDTFKLCLCTRKMTVRGEITQIPMDIGGANDARNALAKEIYSRLFCQIVAQANESLRPASPSAAVSPSSNYGGLIDNDLCIGLLDIFGFEKFKSNSFEQLCINYANEKLQQYFINYVLKKEQELYIEEGIHYSIVTPIDNVDILLLMEDRKTGIFTRLDDELKIPKSTDETFLKKVEGDHNLKTNPTRRFFRDIKMTKSQFEVRHFAGSIRYDVRGFLEKNRDRLYDHLEELLCTSTNERFRDIMINHGPATAVAATVDRAMEYEGGSGSSSNKNNLAELKALSGSATIATRFQWQLQSLMTILGDSHPHFIKCIKPNNVKAANHFDSDMILLQLRYSGVLEAIQIRKSGYPARRTHNDFRRMYWMLAKSVARQFQLQQRRKNGGGGGQQMRSDAELCVMIVNDLKEQNMTVFGELQIGSALVFMKTEMLQVLESEKRGRALVVIYFIQSKVRQFRAQKYFLLKLDGLRLLNKCVEQGKMCGECNTEAISSIEHELTNCRYRLDLPMRMLRVAQELLQRLILVKECLIKIDAYLTSAAFATSNTNEADVSVEYQALGDMLTTAESLKIDTPELNRLRARKNELYERATCLLQLKSAIEEAEELPLQEALKATETLCTIFGRNFCAEEVAKGEKVLTVVRAEKEAMTMVLNIIEDFQRTVQIQTINNNDNDEDATNSIDGINNNYNIKDALNSTYISNDASFNEKSNAKINQTNSMTKQKRLELQINNILLPYRSNHATSPITRWVVEVVSIILALQDKWANMAWADVSCLFNNLKEVGLKLELSNNTRTVQCDQLQRLANIVSVELGMTQVDIKQNYLLPMLHKSLTSNTALKELLRPSKLSDNYEYYQMEFERLVETLSEAKQFSWCFDKSTELFGAIEHLIELRKLFLNQQWEDVIIRTEDSIQRSLRLSLTVSRNSFVTEDENQAAISKFQNTLELLGKYPIVKSVSSGIDNSNLSIPVNASVDQLALEKQIKIEDVYELIATELFALRYEALDNYFLYLVHTSISLCSIQSSSTFFEDGEQTEIIQRTTDATPLNDVLDFIDKFCQCNLPHLSNILLPSVETSTVLSYMRDLVNICLLDQKKKHHGFDSTIVEMWQSNQIPILSVDLLKSVPVRGIECLRSIQLQTVVILRSSFSRCAIAAITKGIENGGLRGLIGKMQNDNIDYISLRESVTYYDNALKALLYYDDIGEAFDGYNDIESLLMVCKQLVLARQCFAEGNESVLAKGQNALDELYYVVEQCNCRSYPRALDLEIQCMKSELLYQHCLEDIKKALYVLPPVQYLIPATKSRKRTMSTGISQQKQALVASTSFDSSIEIMDEILQEEGLMLNEEMLDTTELQRVLLVADNLRTIFASSYLRLRKNDDYNEDNDYDDERESEDGDKELPMELTNHIKAAELIMRMRNAVKQLNWSDALDVYNEIKSDNLTKRVPVIEEEVLGGAEHINNFAIISSCRNALSRGHPTGPIGQFDYKNIILDSLDDAIKVCQSNGCNTRETEELYKAVLVIADLRRAQKIGDGGAIKAALDRAETEGVAGYILSTGEIRRAKIELENFEAVHGLKNAIIEEELTSQQSILDVESMSIKELSDACLKANTTILEVDRGEVLRALLAFAEAMLKSRKAAISKERYVLKSVLSLLTESFEVFQSELEKIDRNSVIHSPRKTVSFRGSSTTYFRGSNTKANSIVISSGHEGSDHVNTNLNTTILNSTQSPLSTVKYSSSSNTGQSAWDQFIGMNEVIKREINAIEVHLAVLQLGDDLIKSLKENAVNYDSNGNIEKSLIKVDDLQIALNAKRELEINSNNSLPQSVLQLSKVANLILDIRTAVLSDKWDTMNTLLEVTLDGDFKMASVEIQIVRKETENRWIITNLTAALASGKLEGELGNTNLNNVSCWHLANCISTAKSLNPRTDMAILLLRTAESMYTLRKMLCEHQNDNIDSDTNALLQTTKKGIDWTAVCTVAKTLLSEVQHQRLDNCILSELRLIHGTAEDTMLCDIMRNALISGSVQGVPGELDYVRISTQDLDAAYKVTMRSTLKTQNAKDLFNACRIIQKLREAVLRTKPQTSENYDGSSYSYVSATVTDAWISVRGYLATIHEAKKENANNISWNSCCDEIELIDKHAYVEQLRGRLLDSVIATSHVYVKRNTVSINPKSEYSSYYTSLFQEQEKLTSTIESDLSGVAKIKIRDPSLDLFCDELTSILTFAKELNFSSDVLDRYITCTNTLLLLRSKIMEENWDSLEELLLDSTEIRHQLQVLREAEQELAWIACELHNHKAVQIIVSSLSQSSLKLSSANNNVDSTIENAQIGRIPAGSAAEQISSYSEQNAKLNSSLQLVQQKYKVTSKAALQLLDCCSNVLHLRLGLEKQEPSSVAQCLRWFKENVHICPLHIQMEAQHAYVLHQNDLLDKNITKALKTGKALGPCGGLVLSKIELAPLESLLEQAKLVQPKFPAVQELCDAAAMALSIRRALRSNKLRELQGIIEVLSAQDVFHPLIVDEIATARAELDDEITVLALVEALKSFDDSESKALDLSFLNNTATVAAAQLSEDDRQNEKESAVKLEEHVPRPGHSILYSFSQRRYSFANKNHSNIDPETIDIAVLDRGIRLANDHGICSAQAKRLFRTVALIKSLRSAMKRSEWLCLEEILTASHFAEEVGRKYDKLACKEIQAIKTQLEMRAAIVDLSKSLKSGWAKCSNGIVDISSISIQTLENAIDRASRSIAELSCTPVIIAPLSSSPSALVNDNECQSEIKSSILQNLNNSNENSTRKVSFLLTSDHFEKHKGNSGNSVVQKQVESLMDSARHVLRIREVLVSGNMELAGSLSEAAVNGGTLHYSVLEELKLYSKEINTALSSMKVFESLRNGMLEGDIEKLGELIAIARYSDAHYSNDLGLIRTLDRAEHIYYSLLEVRRRASCLADEYDPTTIRTILQRGALLNMAESELKQLRLRLDKLLMFDTMVSKTIQSSGGLISDRIGWELILKHASDLHLNKHPLARVATLRLRLSANAFRSTVIAESLMKDNIYSIATETIRLKRQYLSMASSVQKYQLNNFPLLRPSQDFGVRMGLISDDLRENMLFHSDQPLPTSLTKQSPVLAALSVTVFSHYIRGIELSMYSELTVVLRQLLTLGQQHPPMRDEIILQLIKQIRRNRDSDAAAIARLWKTLLACLYHFPPSRVFECYLELYLIQATAAATTSTSHSNSGPSQNTLLLAQRCIRYMHHSIIKYGYERKIIESSVSSSLKDLSLWYCSETGMHNPNSGSVVVLVDNAFVDQTTYTPSIAVSANNATSAVEGTLVSSNIGDSLGSRNRLSAALLSEIAPTVIPSSTGGAMRGVRADWIHRFQLFHHQHTSSSSHIKRRDGGDMSRLVFIEAVTDYWSQSNCSSSSSKFDQLDRDMILFLLSSSSRPVIPGGCWKAIFREYQSASDLFHHMSKEEASSSQGRLHWLDEHISNYYTTVTMTSLSTSSSSSAVSVPKLNPYCQKHHHQQQQSISQTELVMCAERFWDCIIAKMAIECTHFQLLKWNIENSHKSSMGLLKSSSNRKTSIAFSESNAKEIYNSSSVATEVTINWELFRELVLIGCKKYIELSINN